jgi:predicted nucleic acid-binding protein
MTLILDKPLVLDTGPLGKIAHPRRRPEVAAWYRKALADGAKIYLPEIADYEVRRNFLLEDLTRALERLDALQLTLEYLPLTTAIMRQAAQLWSDARKQGRPTADPKEIDGDAILAAQALSVGGVVVTDNPGHLSRYIETKTWQEITS